MNATQGPIRIAPSLRVVVLVRHGETTGESSIRYHGANDVPLNDVGRAHARAAAAEIGDLAFDAHVASSLSRASESAEIIRPGAEIVLDDDLREVDFGRWEGLTRDEIVALDPELEARWRREGHAFDFPDGERRHDFRARVDRGLARAFARNVESLLVVAHKGVVRRGVELLTSEPPPPPHPELGEVFHLVRSGEGFVRRGRG
jgi:broad specificity phosphatase PhoE